MSHLKLYLEQLDFLIVHIQRHLAHWETHQLSSLLVFCLQTAIFQNLPSGNQKSSFLLSNSGTFPIIAIFFHITISPFPVEFFRWLCIKLRFHLQAVPLSSDQLFISSSVTHHKMAPVCSQTKHFGLFQTWKQANCCSLDEFHSLESFLAHYCRGSFCCISSSPV